METIVTRITIHVPANTSLSQFKADMDKAQRGIDRMVKQIVEKPKRTRKRRK